MDSRTETKVIIRAAGDQDRKSIYAIRHAIYAQELGQYETNPAGELRDKLDGQNHYIVARYNNELIGFISITTPASASYSVDKYFDRSSLPFPFDSSLYEIRILSVTRAHRSGPAAYLLMYAAMRWVESHGGKNIVAICRSELLEMYRKTGLKPLGFSTRAGSVTYELSAASLEDFHRFLHRKMQLFKSLESRTDWQLPFSFFAPAPCYHGGAFFTAIGEHLQTLHRRDDVINADVLDAWFPPSPKAIEALQNNLAWLLQTSPPTHGKGLVQMIATVRGVPESSILPGAGSSDLIFLALQYFLRPGSKVLILDPCYGEYRHVLDKIVRCSVTPYYLQRKEGFQVDTDALLQEIQQGYDMVILVNPNSPTGVYTAREQLINMLVQVPASTLVWIDETYVDYAGTSGSLEQFAVHTENVIICKSMSKAYALSGARVGYLCCSAHLIESLRSLTPPWAVSLPGQLAAIVALQDGAYYDEKYKETRLLRKKMRAELMAAGMEEVIEGVANFLLCYIPDYAGPVSGFVDACSSHNLYVRDVSAMGTTLGKGAVRIAVKDAKTNEKIVAVVQQLLTTAKSRWEAASPNFFADAG